MDNPLHSSDFPQERRRQPRRSVNIAATIRISTYEGTIPFEFKNAVVCDVCEQGLGISLTVETAVSRAEFSKIVVRRRGCYVSCSFPGQKSASQLYGEIAWVEPHVTPSGTVIRFGVSLDEKFPGNRTDLHAFLTTLPTPPAQPGGMQSCPPPAR